MVSVVGKNDMEIRGNLEQTAWTKQSYLEMKGFIFDVLDIILKLRNKAFQRRNNHQNPFLRSYDMIHVCRKPCLNIPRIFDDFCDAPTLQQQIYKVTRMTFPEQLYKVKCIG